jgi:hypothetical protein
MLLHKRFTIINAKKYQWRIVANTHMQVIKVQIITRSGIRTSANDSQTKHSTFQQAQAFHLELSALTISKSPCNPTE